MLTSVIKMCSGIFFFFLSPCLWSRTVPTVLSVYPTSAGQPPQLSEALTEPPQLNWSRVLQGWVLLLSLPRPPGAGLVVGWGGHRYQLCGEMIWSPCSIPLGSPTVTHGTPATRSFHCCGAMGGGGAYYQERRLSSEDPVREPDLQLHLFCIFKVFF